MNDDNDDDDDDNDDNDNEYCWPWTAVKISEEKK